MWGLQVSVSNIAGLLYIFVNCILQFVNFCLSRKSLDPSGSDGNSDSDESEEDDTLGTANENATKGNGQTR